MVIIKIITLNSLYVLNAASHPNPNARRFPSTFILETGTLENNRRRLNPGQPNRPAKIRGRQDPAQDPGN